MTGREGTQSSPSKNLNTGKEPGHWGMCFMCVYAGFQLELVTHSCRCFAIISKAADMSYESLEEQSCHLSHRPSNSRIAHFPPKKAKASYLQRGNVLRNKGVLTVFRQEPRDALCSLCTKVEKA